MLSELFREYIVLIFGEEIIYSYTDHIIRIDKPQKSNVIEKNI